MSIRGLKLPNQTFLELCRKSSPEPIETGNPLGSETPQSTQEGREFEAVSEAEGIRQSQT
ncbi:hypothetical protein LEP1GSC047_3270 [Leptospira inadai serovar Lyme str. 10]|uniref:Uncharacterized protein n=2 Tax=Leptospira inadai serovar Lyme TaxID=293084 RepID=V6HII5_9LEPT|nr:hypothetical protein [Leptospira inadai]EQA36495.1 hypothetical protein LEP1GSC047_3270 [Leptospira inadai serovar Lyme str. 10]PNV74543.1 hypothetical protein BES34_013475 [Leptospira inadai serovar Lyme]